MIDLEITYVICNAVAYVVVPFLLYYRWNIRNEVFFISIIWAVSAIASVLFYFNPVYDLMIMDSINPYALLFYYFCYLSLLYPLFYVNSYTISVEIPEDHRSNIYLLLIIIAFSSIIPLIENIMELFKDGFSGLFSLGEKYETISEEIRNGEFVNNLSPLTRFIQARFLFPIIYIIPILMFLYFGKESGKKLLFVLLIASSLLPGIMCLARGQRSIIVSQALYLFYLFLLLRQTFSVKLYKKIKKVFSIIGLFIVIFVLLISFSRFGLYSNAEGSTVEVVSGFALRYYTEHFYNFSNKLFDSNPFCMGEYALDFHSGHPHSWEYWSDRLGVPAFYFYGTIGDLFKDFSYYVLPIILLGGFIITKLDRSKFSTLIIVLLWAIFLTNGLFGCFFEVGFSGYFCLVVAIILKLFKL